MKLYVSLIILFLAISPVFSQKTRTIKKKINHSQLEIYDYDRRAKAKHGNYLLLNNNDTLISGKYNQNNRIGIWKYNDEEGNPYLTYDHDNNKTIWQSDEISGIDMFLILHDSELLLTKVERPPLLLGYRNMFNKHITDNVILTLPLVQGGIGGIGYASVTINANGELSDINVDKSLHRDLDKIIINAIKSCYGKWLPAIVDGEAVDSKINLIFNVSGSGFLRKIEEKPYQQVFEIVYYSTTSVRTTTTETQRVIRRY